MKVLALLALALLAAAAAGPAAAEEFYGPNSGVLNLDASSFDGVVNRPGTVTLVEFYAPWCGHCKSLKPEWIKAARALSGMVQVAAVNADEAKNRGLASKYGIRGFPTIKVFKAGESQPADYNGQRTAKAIASFAKKELPSRVSVLSAKAFDKWHAKHAAVPRVVLFTDKSAVSAVFKSLSMQFDGHAAIGQVHKREKAVVKRYEVSSFPSLVVVRPGDEGEQHVAYDGKLKPKAVARWIRRFAPGAPGGEDDYLPQVVDQSCLEKYCRGKASLCALLVLGAGQRDSPAMDAAMGARDSRSDSLFSFAWVDQDAQAGWLREAFGVEPQEYAQLVVLAARKGRYAQLVGTVSDAGSVNSFLDRVLRGSAKTSPLASGRKELPAMAGETEACAPKKKAKQGQQGGGAKKEKKRGGGGGGGPAGPGSVELTADNFDALVLGSKQPWMVEFYAPWCGHCKQLAPHWAKAAKKTRGQVRFGQVNCDDVPALASRFGVQGFPTVKVFAAGDKGDGSGAADYAGQRTAEALVRHALQLVPSDAVAVLDEAPAFPAWFGQGADVMRVMLISDKAEPSRLLNALQLEYDGRLQMAHVPASSGLAEQFGVTEFPAVVVLDRPSRADAKTGAVASQRYEGPLTYPALSQFCGALAAAQAGQQQEGGGPAVGDPVVPHTVTLATSQAEFDEGCASRGGVCVVAFLRPALMGGADGGEPSAEELALAELAEANKNKPVHFVAMDREAQAEFWAQFGLNEDLDATLVVLSIKRGRYAPMVSLFDAPHIQQFVDDVLAARVRTAKLPGGRLAPVADEGPAPEAKQGEAAAEGGAHDEL